MSVFSKIGSFFSIRDDEEELYEDEVPSGRVVPLSSAGRRGGKRNGHRGAERERRRAGDEHAPCDAYHASHAWMRRRAIVSMPGSAARA